LTSLKELYIYICPPQGTSGGVPSEEVPFSSNVLNTFSNPIVAQKMPHLSMLHICTEACVIDFNGFANFGNLKSLLLWFGAEVLSQEECDSIFKVDNFRQKVKSVQYLDLKCYNSVVIKRFDFIFEQYPFLRHLNIELDGDSDQIYLIATIRKDNLNHLESLTITNFTSGRQSSDNQLPDLFCDDSIKNVCPQLTKLSLNLSNASTLLILKDCSEFIKQLTFDSFKVKGRVGIKHIIKRLDSNKRNENIIFNIGGRFRRLAEQLLKNYSEKFRHEHRSYPRGSCLMKCQNELMGSLIWQIKNSKKERQLCFHPGAS
jgi:hypothetical protein